MTEGAGDAATGSPQGTADDDSASTSSGAVTKERVTAATGSGSSATPETASGSAHDATGEHNAHEPPDGGEPADSAGATPSAAGGLPGMAAALLRLPDHLLGGLRSLALEVIVILGLGSLVGFVLHFTTGQPRIFIDIWTAGTYICFLVGAPLAALALLTDLRHPGLIDWWPGGMSPRTRFRMPSTSLLYLPFDAVPVVVALLAAREPPIRTPVGMVVVGTALGVSAAVAVMRVVSRLRHGPATLRPTDAASAEQSPEGARAVAALAAMVVPLLGLVVALLVLGAGFWSWVLAGLGYAIFVALVKIALALPPRPLVPVPTPKGRRSSRSRRS